MPGYLGTFELLLPFETQGSLLQISGEAVALAALGIYLKDENVILRSRGKYARALKLAREALYTPLSPPSNATILAVLLFSLYEVSKVSMRFMDASVDLCKSTFAADTLKQICCSDNSLLGWASHIRGALELAKLQSGVQTDDLVSRKLMLAVQNQNVNDVQIKLSCSLLTLVIAHRNATF